MRKACWLSVAPYLASLLGWVALTALGTTVIFTITGVDHAHGWQAYRVMLLLGHSLVTGTLLSLAAANIAKTAERAFYSIHREEQESFTWVPGPSISRVRALVFLWKYQQTDEDQREIYQKLAEDGPEVDPLKNLKAARALSPGTGKVPPVSFANLHSGIHRRNRGAILGGFSRNMFLGGVVMVVVAAGALPEFISHTEKYQPVQGVLSEAINDETQSIVETSAGVVIVSKVDGKAGEEVTIYKTGDNYRSDTVGTEEQVLEGALVIFLLVGAQAVLVGVVLLVGWVLLVASRFFYPILQRSIIWFART